MNQRQKESASKYLYNISKSTAILSVIVNMVQGKWELTTFKLQKNPIKSLC